MTLDRLDPDDLEELAGRMVALMRSELERPEILTPEEVADELRVDREWVYRKARSGDLPAIKIGKFWRIRRDAFDDWIAEQQTDTVRAT